MSSTNPWDVNKSKFGKRSSRSSASERPAGGRPRPAAGAPHPESLIREITTGRLLALRVLELHDQTGRFLQDLLQECDSQHQLSSQDRAAAVDMASGVVRRRRTIDVLLRSQITRERARIEDDLWRVLQLGTYQLVYAKTPDHAAVDSTVELCRALDRERWTGFTNAALRGIGRMLTDEICDACSADALPLSAGQYRRLNSPAFPDPSTDFPGYLGDGFSLPSTLADRWATRLPREQALKTCFYSVDSPPTTLRVNLMRSSIAEVVESLNEHGCSAIPGRVPGSVIVAGANRPERLPGFVDGKWSVQDESSMAASRLLNPIAGELILDLCAAPGGKTTHLAELSRDKATIIACDVSQHRLDRVRENADRLQLKKVEVALIGRDGSGVPDGPFHAILADVPCSNTGVLCRRPEARWRFHPAELAELVQLQTKLLLTACERVRMGGRVVYSTCSMEPEENRGVVDSVLRAFPDFLLKQEIQHIAGSPADGGYQALLIRRG